MCTFYDAYYFIVDEMRKLFKDCEVTCTFS